jgi:hypothetical protein
VVTGTNDGHGAVFGSRGALALAAPDARLDELVQQVEVGKLGLAAAGLLLEALGTRPVFVIIAAGMTVLALYFASVALRFGPRDLPETAAVAA